MNGPLERNQADADHKPLQRHEGEDHTAANDRLNGDQSLKRLVDVIQRNRDHEGPIVRQRERGGTIGKT